MRAPPSLLVHGDARHGVARLAGELADAVATLGHDGRVTAPPAAGAMHVHFTDRLWASTPERAADRVADACRGLRLTVTLHDVPQESDGVHLSRRACCYRRVVGLADGVACNSEHELSLLRRAGVIAPRGRCEVVPLPVWPARPEAAARRPEVALLGWVYPGKGHEAAIDAVGAIGRAGLRVRALGAVAAGHDPDAELLRRRARRAGVDFAITGWLSEPELHSRCATAAVPLAAHAHISASGSIGSWVSAGRRPLVADSPYAREIARLRPGTIARYRTGRLAEAIATALDDERRTFLAPGADTRPDIADVAGRYLEWWTR